MVLLINTFLQLEKVTLQQHEGIREKMKAHMLSQLNLLQQAPRPAAVKATPYIRHLQSVIVLLKLESLLNSLDVDDSVLSTAHNMLETAVLEISQNAAQIADNALPEIAQDQARKLCLLSVCMAIDVTRQKLRMKSTMRPALSHLWICRMLGVLVPGYASGIFVSVTNELLAKGGQSLSCWMLSPETLYHMVLGSALPQSAFVVLIAMLVWPQCTAGQSQQNAEQINPSFVQDIFPAVQWHSMKRVSVKPWSPAVASQVAAADDAFVAVQTLQG